MVLRPPRQRPWPVHIFNMWTFLEVETFSNVYNVRERRRMGRET